MKTIHPNVASRGRRAVPANELESLEPRQLLTASGVKATPIINLAAQPAQTTPTKHGKHQNKHSKHSKNALPAGLAAPPGYSPARLRHAYGIDNITFGGGTIVGDGTGMTIAVIDAYHNPTIVSDLHNFDVAFKLPDPPSFKMVAQDGSTNYPILDPTANGVWTMEADLDVEWAHAMAPGANILLVECASDDLSDLIDQGVNYARNQPGVVAISMSWGASEWNTESLDEDGFFSTPPGHAPITFFAATGDTGTPSIFPAYSPKVVAIGGTSLTSDASGNYTSETGWVGSGGGISQFEPRPPYQVGTVTQLPTRRANPDVSFAADPYNGGASVYDQTNNEGTPGPWETVGGTSLGTPTWAALVTIANQFRGLAGIAPLDTNSLLTRLYSLPQTDFHDVTSGGNATYQASAGYDFVTGRGSPIADKLVPDLVSAGPVGLVASSAGQVGPVSSFDVHFSTAMDTSSFDPATDVVSFTGPNGAIAINGFSWSSATTLHLTFAPQTRVGTYSLVLGPQILSTNEVPMDQNGDFTPGQAVDTFTTGFTIVSTVAGRSVFYNDSAFDGGDPNANSADDNAVATDKAALLPGQTAGAANFTNYSRGLNGVMVDIAGLANGAALSANDFTFKIGNNSDPSTWTTAPTPTISVRSGAGANGSDRITLTWGDNVLQNTWLQVTVKATANTGLGAADVFYFGNLIGDANGNGAVTVADIAQTKSQSGQSATITSPTDFNRNGQITVADVAIAKAYQGNSLTMFTAPAVAPAAAPSAESVSTITGSSSSSGGGSSAATAAATKHKHHKGKHAAAVAASLRTPFSTTSLIPMLPHALSQS
jgi:hypothetical protein